VKYVFGIFDFGEKSYKKIFIIVNWVFGEKKDE